MSDETQPAPIDIPPDASVPGQAAPRPLPEAVPVKKRRWLRRALWVLAVIIAWPIVMTVVYSLVPPPVSNIMLIRVLSGNGIDKSWKSLAEISPALPRAVISSEDARFCEHNGVDWVEFQDAVVDPIDAGEAPTRGASTIPMQTAKNLFLWDGRFALRKVLELPLALWMDLVWPKHRMIEIYLNIVEWAPGVYGAEAAARYHFKKSAKDLTKKEAALLAAVLPNPIKRNAGKPSKGVRSIANRILIRMAGMGPYLACLGD